MVEKLEEIKRLVEITKPEMEESFNDTLNSIAKYLNSKSNKITLTEVEETVAKVKAMLEVVRLKAITTDILKTINRNFPDIDVQTHTLRNRIETVFNFNNNQQQ